MKIHTFSNRLVAVTLGLAVVGIGAQSAFAADVWSESLVGVTNHVVSGYIDALDFSYHGDNSVSSSAINQSFTGLNQNNVSQTMNFTGTNWAQSDFGRLHCYASGTFTNTYYNASNPLYYNSDTGFTDPNGSPDGVASLGFAGFNDTLHYGGTLQAGYKARYYFHVDGTNTGDGALTDMSFGIKGYNDESFFAFDPGSTDTTWVTQSYDVNGTTPQDMHVQFSNQFTAESWNVADGTNFSGTSDFSSTLTLTGIEMLDANGNQVSGWTVTSDSGTQYGTVPEPTSIAVIAIGALGFIARRRKRA
jgi:hypothetical protein